jgi:hypothetical protein
MKSAYVTISAVMLVLFAATPVFAQRAEAPPLPERAPSPNLSLPEAALQAQERAAAAMLDRADTELPSAAAATLNRVDTEILQQTPSSGVTRPEMGVTRALSGDTGLQ